MVVLVSLPLCCGIGKKYGKAPSEWKKYEYIYYIILHYIKFKLYYILYYMILYCIILCCVVLCCIVLCCVVLCCVVLYCIVLYCIVLYSIILHYIILYYVISNKIVFEAIGALGIVVGIACLFMPWLGAMGSCVPFVDGICDGRCVQCSSTDRENLNSFCQADTMPTRVMLRDYVYHAISQHDLKIEYIYRIYIYMHIDCLLFISKGSRFYSRPWASSSSTSWSSAGRPAPSASWLRPWRAACAASAATPRWTTPACSRA